MNKVRSVLLLSCDLLIILTAYLLTSKAMEIGPIDSALFLCYSSFLFLLFYVEGLYTLETFDPLALPVSLVRASALSLGGTLFLLVALSFVTQLKEPMFLIVNSLSLPYLVYLARTRVLEFLSSGLQCRDTVLIGAADTLQQASEAVNKRPFLGYRIQKQLTPDQIEFIDFPGKNNLVALERSLLSNTQLRSRLQMKEGIEVVDLLVFAEHVCGKIPLASIDEEWVMNHCYRSNSWSYDLSKAMLDKGVAIILLILLAPLALVLLPLLLIVHGRPIFFKQTRTGLNNQPFTLYKLRTMVTDAEKNGGAQWCRPGDSRITPLGKWLRKTRIDELPQLYNILRGDMSLVGPRPERPEIIQRDLRGRISHYDLRHCVKPGVTGWAQVAFRYAFTMEDAREKLQFDLYYVKNRTLWMDLAIIAKTIKTVLTGAGQ